jgi:mannose/fructose-specific phosphotransferase system component IIA
LLKKRLNAEERYGLNFDQVREAEKYLRQHKTAGAMGKQEAMPIYELFLLGYSLEDLSRKFPQYSLGKITLTAALNGWVKDREKLANSIYDRIRARIVKSTVEQVEFLTDMVSVSTTENMEEMRKYLQDPSKAPPPQMRIKSLKEYQQVIEMLAKVADSVRALSIPAEADQPKLLSKNKPKALPKPEQADESILLAQLVQDPEDE